MSYGNEVKWNPWHGCHKFSAGCKNCFVFSMDKRYGRDTESVSKNSTYFHLPLASERNGDWRYPAGTLFATCFSSDFFLEDADPWRDTMWEIMRIRSDCKFFIITKRIHRVREGLPADWGDGYDNVAIAVTCESQEAADKRLPVYLDLPIKEKAVICAPLLEKIDLTPYLKSQITKVSVGGESGYYVRDCNSEWILDIREQCIANNVGFEFRQTGSNLVIDGRIYNVPKQQQKLLAAEAGLDWFPENSKSCW